MGLDSVEMLLDVEDEFGISITNEDAADVRTVGDLHALILRKLSGAEHTEVLVGAPIGQEVWERRARLLVREWAIAPEAIRPEAEIVRHLGID